MKDVGVLISDGEAFVGMSQPFVLGEIQVGFACRIDIHTYWGKVVLGATLWICIYAWIVGYASETLRPMGLDFRSIAREYMRHYFSFVNIHSHMNRKFHLKHHSFFFLLWLLYPILSDSLGLTIEHPGQPFYLCIIHSFIWLHSSPRANQNP